MKLKLAHYILLGVISSVLTIQLHSIVFTFTESNIPKSSIVIEKETSDAPSNQSSINANEEKDIKEARRRGPRGGFGGVINIYDEDGEVTTWGWWLANIAAPLFLVGEVVKIFIGFIVFPFSEDLASNLFVGGFRNIGVMFPGLMFYLSIGLIGVLIDLARANCTDSKTLQELAQHEVDNVRKEVASNSYTPRESLQKLAQDEHEGVREKAASNPNTPHDILQKLAWDGKSFVRKEVATNPNTPHKSLQKLAQDEEEFVREEASSNPNFSP